jgi:hypothetical protein
MCVWAGIVGASLCATIAGAASTQGDLSAVWQHRKLTFNYVGFTTAFTCDGLDTHVRQILLHLGARKDAKVTATGCPGPGNPPSKTAWVAVDFYALAPATDASAPADRVSARWSPVELTPQRPSFMDDGDCELIQGMKDLITQNFTLRDVEYRTDCFPHTVTIDGFAVKGQALRASPAA